jgi:hypothetical protein
MKSAVATPKLARRGGRAVSSVSLNHRHDAPQGRGYNIQETASSSDNLHSCMQENESHVRMILFVGFSYTMWGLP